MPVNKEKTAMILRKALELMKRYSLCKGTLARNKQGTPVSYRSSEAAKFCAYGFIDRASLELRKRGKKITGSHELAAAEYVARINEIGPLAPFSDKRSTTKRHVRAAFKKALASLEGKARRGRTQEQR